MVHLRYLRLVTAVAVLSLLVLAPSLCPAQPVITIQQFRAVVLRISPCKGLLEPLDEISSTFLGRGDIVPVRVAQLAVRLGRGMARDVLTLWLAAVLAHVLVDPPSLVSLK